MTTVRILTLSVSVDVLAADIEVAELVIRLADLIGDCSGADGSGDDLCLQPHIGLGLLPDLSRLDLEGTVAFDLLLEAGLPAFLLFGGDCFLLHLFLD